MIWLAIGGGVALAGWIVCVVGAARALIALDRLAHENDAREALRALSK